MRIAFSGTGFVGHLVPMFPLLRAFAAAGHEVAVITSLELEGFLRREATEQLTVLPAGPLAGVTLRRMSDELGISPASDPVPPVIARFFAGRLVDAGVIEGLASATAWRPDVVISEAMDHIGAFVAGETGAAFYRHTFGPDRPPQLGAALRRVASERAERYGLVLAPPRAVLDIFPAGLQAGPPDPALRRIPVRPEIHRRPRTVVAPHRPAVDPSRPRALVTFGTVFTDPGLRDRAADHFDPARWDVVVTTGGDTVPPAPAPVSRTYVPFTPLGDLLAGTDVVVTAGGEGTVLSALRAGIPMVVHPLGADHEVNADRAVAAGVAVVVRDVAEVGAAADLVASEPGFRLRAAALAAEVASMPPAARVAVQVVHEIEAVRAH
ncbi:glycosyltransferase [Jatrophihabitans sp. YIM 134969]